MKTRLLSLALGTLFVGCAADLAELKDDAPATTADELRLASNQVLEVGRIDLGGRRAVRHTGSPRFRALRLRADGGTRIDLRVRSNAGFDAMVWLTDGDRTVVASNDDSDGTLDSRITVALPGTGSRDWLVVFREYYGRPDTFSVTVDRAATCTYGGASYNPGDNFPSTDLCNTCTCSDNGSVGCTKRACAPACIVNGTRYEVGQSFRNDCNQCTCTTGGIARCTLAACPPRCDPANEPNRRYVGTSPEICARIRYACMAGETGFSNACGCGCERAAP